MNGKGKDLDQILDRPSSEIRESRLDPAAGEGGGRPGVEPVSQRDRTALARTSRDGTSRSATAPTSRR